jgi:hypothetical protein
MSTEMNTFKEQFDTKGYFYVRGVLSEEECDLYTAAVDNRLAIHDKEDRFLPDGPNLNAEFWPLIVHEQVIEILRSVVGPDLKYTLQGDLHANHNAHQWHRDLAYKHSDMPIAYDDVETPFRVVKICFYVDPGEMAFAMVPKSAHNEMKNSKRYFGIDTYEDPYFSEAGGDDLAKADGVDPPVLFCPRRGDMAAFDLRLLHAGCFIDPDTKLPCPAQPQSKKTIFFTYGADNEWTRKVHYFYRFFRKDLLYSSPAPELVALIKQKGLLLSGFDDPQAQDPSWFDDTFLVPPYMDSNDTPYGVIGSAGWYEKVAENFEQRGHPLSAASCLSRAHTIVEEEMKGIDTKLNENEGSSAAALRELKKKKTQFKKQMSTDLTKHGDNCVKIGWDDEARNDFREAVRLNPFNLKARLKGLH